MQTILLNIQLIVKHQAQCNCVTNNLFRQHAIDAKRKTEQHQQIVKQPHPFNRIKRSDMLEVGLQKVLDIS